MAQTKAQLVSPNLQIGTGVTIYGNSGIVSATTLTVENITGVAATFTGDSDFDNGTLYVDSANDRVGIGTNTPGDLLHIDSDSNTRARIWSTQETGTIFQNTGLNLRSYESSTNTANVGDILVTGPNATTLGGAGRFIIRGQDDVSLAFYTDNTERLGISTLGDVTLTNDLNVTGDIKVNAGVITASSGIVTYYGDGQYLANVVSGIELKEAGSSVGTSLTAINFASGATLTPGSGGISTITIAAGISTTASSPAANTVVTLNLSTAQHHDLTLSAGITTITCEGGTFGESHSVVITQPSSGIATVGFSTYFLFPSGSTPSMSEGGGSIDLISFVVKRVGTAGTQLLASAGLNYQ